jgi:hypothetical protein
MTETGTSLALLREQGAAIAAILAVMAIALFG